MPSVVYKFGGTSLGSAECIQKVCDIIYADEPSFVVLSAIAGVTDMLESFYASSAQERRSLLRDLQKKHEAIVRDLNVPFPVSSWISRLFPYVNQQHLSVADRANILALGEDIAVALVKAVCRSRSLNIQSLEARDVILTDDNYSRATPDLSLMRRSWKDRQLSANTSYIIQGFIGASQAGETTILGRGGSDYTAALIAEICNASEVRIYTDVSGVYTMDPKVVENAQRIPELSFEEMQNLARFGAKVLYPPMLSPCMRAGIPIFVTSTFHSTQEGTWIYAIEREESLEPKITALSLRQNQSLCSIDFSSLDQGMDELVYKLHSLGIFPELITTQNHTCSFILDNEGSSSEKLQSLQHALSTFRVVRLHHDMALITIVGSGLSCPKVMSTMMEGLHLQVAPLFCSQSSKVLSFAVMSSCAKSIIAQLHNDFVKQDI